MFSLRDERVYLVYLRKEVYVVEVRRVRRGVRRGEVRIEREVGVILRRKGSYGEC